jgi:predicted DNA-binding transcriptional regulator AlpA
MSADHAAQARGAVMMDPGRPLPALFDEEYYRAKDAAAYLRTSPSTLAKRRLYGTGPRFCRIGRAIRYRKSDLDEFMASSAVHTTFAKPQS